jgi:hypothetical protein
MKKKATARFFIVKSHCRRVSSCSLVEELPSLPPRAPPCHFLVGRSLDHPAPLIYLLLPLPGHDADARRWKRVSYRKLSLLRPISQCVSTIYSASSSHTVPVQIKAKLAKCPMLRPFCCYGYVTKTKTLISIVSAATILPQEEETHALALKGRDLSN